MSRYELFDRSQIQLLELAQRGHDMTAEKVRALAPPQEPFEHPELNHLVDRIRAARSQQQCFAIELGRHRFITKGLRRAMQTVNNGRIEAGVLPSGGLLTMT